MPLTLQNCSGFMKEIFMDNLILIGLCFPSVLPVILKNVKRNVYIEPLNFTETMCVHFFQIQHGKQIHSLAGG